MTTTNHAVVHVVDVEVSLGALGVEVATHANCTNQNNSLWYPNYGVTHHVTNNLANLMDNISLSSSDQVLLGNDQGLSISSIGSYKFYSTYKPHTSLELQNLLIFARDNLVYFEFNPTFCLVKSHANFEFLLRGILGTDGLFTFGNILSIPPIVSTSHCTPCVNYIGCKINNTSSLGAFIMSFFTMIYGGLPLLHPHVVTITCLFVLMCLPNTYGSFLSNLNKIRVQIDGAGEFCNLTSYFEKHGIVHRFTCPHTHHQNGSIKQKHHHVVETSLTLLAQASLPLTFWDHAFFSQLLT
ncbi:hypothetical protein CR513_00025, partial [Mucuna pruriens]